MADGTGTKVRITRQLLASGASRNGGWSKEQLGLLGVTWPPKRGWVRRIVGKWIDEEAVIEFFNLANQHLDQE